MISTSKKLWQPVFWLAFKLGLTAFGGPAAHIAMLRDEVVTRRAWVSDLLFIDWLGAVNLIPGPNSTEMVMHVGLHRAGWRGLLAAGFGFIIPAVSMTFLFAWAYVQFGSTPNATALLYGIKPVMIAVITHAIFSLFRISFKSWQGLIIGLCVLVGSLFGINEIALLFGGTAFGFLLNYKPAKTPLPSIIIFPALLLTNLKLEIPVAPTLVLGGVFWGFLKIGTLLYGSGYVLIAFLRSEFVTRLGWLTEQQLLDAIAIGQLTPGPLFSSATFVGYLIAGAPGAILASIAIFAPAFVFVGLTGTFVPKLRSKVWTSKLLDAVNAASIGLMLAVTIELGRSALTDMFTIGLAITAMVLLWRFKISSAWLVALGALMGWCWSVLH